MKPKISIIVPIYNTGKYLNRCIDSILNQSFKDFELILVNDGSTDNSKKIIDEYAKNDRRIKVIHKKNGGQGSARNRGLDIAQGDYIGFVDSDDWIHKDMYKFMYAIAIQNNVAIVQVNNETTNLFFDDKCFEASKVKINRIDNVLKKFSECNSFEILPFIFPVNKIYHRSIWSKLRYPEGKFAEDLRVVYKVYEQAKEMICIDYKFYYYYMSENSSTRSEFSINKLEDIEAWEEILEFYKQNYPDIDRTNLNMIYCRRIRGYYFSINSNSKYKLQQKQLYQKFREIFISCVKTKKHNWKEKSVDISFFISPKLCKYIFQKRINL